MGNYLKQQAFENAGVREEDIHYDSFVEIRDSVMDMHDENRDGVITPNELRRDEL